MESVGSGVHHIETPVSTPAPVDSREASTGSAQEHHSYSDKGSPTWQVLGRNLPKQDVAYFAQILIIYAVVIASLVNLTMYKDENKVWIALLSSCIGYMLPQPQLKQTVKLHSILPN